MPALYIRSAIPLRSRTQYDSNITVGNGGANMDEENNSQNLSTLRLKSIHSIIVIKDPEDNHHCLVFQDGWRLEFIGRYHMIVADCLDLMRRTVFALVAGGANVEHVFLHTNDPDRTRWRVDYSPKKGESNALRLTVV